MRLAILITITSEMSKTGEENKTAKPLNQSIFPLCGAFCRFYLVHGTKVNYSYNFHL